MAPNTPRWSIDDVLARTDLARLLDECTQPATTNTRGRRWHCPVPDHLDKNASVTMHTDARGHERWRCWSGDDHHRGDAIDLIVATRAVSRAEAINDLARRAGLVIGEPPPPLPHRSRPTPSGPRPLDPAVARYAQACERILWTHTGDPVREWLHARGLGDDILRANHVGADPGRTMLRRQRGLPYGATPAVTFPALDPAGQVRYLQARYLNPAPDGPKYDNPARYLGSNPRAAWTIQVESGAGDALVVCEGIPDALTAAQAGYASVGILGAQYPDVSIGHRIAGAAERLQLPVVAVIDADPAGRQWGERLAHHMHEAGGSVHLIEPPSSGLDLNDWAQQDPTWTRQVARAIEAPDQTARLHSIGQPVETSAGLEGREVP